MATEKRTIKAHPKLIFDVITRQAGTLGKAILEGIMNSADARATFCEVTIDENHITIRDDGSGIASKQDIEDFFETLGTPHDKSEKKVYGTFRMGRGQIFSFGDNVWRTSEFLMHVDVMNKGLEYDLETSLKSVNGCRIDVKLYKKLLPSDLYDVIRDVKKMAKYVPLVLKVNGEVASIDPTTEKWDHVTDEAYIRLTSSASLAVYNLGVWVRDFGNYQFGCGGVVVSKEQLRLNFARNDIMSSDCSVWKKVKKFVDQKATTKNKNKPILDDGERQRLASQIMSGEISGESAAVLKVFTDVSGKHISARQICRCSFSTKITHAPKGDMRGDKLMQQKMMFVFADETLERFEVNIDGIIKILQQKCNHLYYSPKIVPFEAATSGMDVNHLILDSSQWTPKEKLILHIFDRCASELLQGFIYMRGDGQSRNSKTRQSLVGSSEAALAWTNGCSYICFSRYFLSGVELNFQGMMFLFTIGLHEYCHDETDSGTHVHSLEFYQQFHDANIGIRLATSAAMGFLPMLIESHGKKLNKFTLRSFDREAKVAAALAKYPKLVEDRQEGVTKPSGKSKIGISLPVAAQVAPKKERVVLPDIDKLQCPYRMSSDYGVLFILGNSKHWTKDDLLATAAQATGKAVGLVSNDLTVLMNPKHKSNGNRSKVERFEDGTIQIVKVELIAA